MKKDYHRGERLRKFLEDHSVKHVDIFSKLSITKQRFYQILNQSDFNVRYIREIAKITGIDPTSYFPDVKFNDEVIHQFIKGYASPEHVTKLQHKLIEIQEEYIQQSRELHEVREELAEYKRIADKEKKE